MTVYLAIAQPDGDWDHLATLFGVYSTQEKAELRIKGWKTAKVIPLEVDTDFNEANYF